MKMSSKQKRMSPSLIIVWAIFLELQPSACQISKNVESNSRVCNTPACRDVAAQFAASMKTTIDPCVNFYKYACGRWLSANPKPQYHDMVWHNPARLTLLAETRLRDELLSADSPSDSQPIRKMKKFYETCMNEEAAESDAVTRIERIIRKSGGWPMVMNSSQSNADCIRWQAVDEYYSEILGTSTFYTIDLIGEEWSDSYNTILIKNPVFYPDLFSSREAYQSLIKQVAEEFIEQNEAIVSSQQLERDINDLITFETKLYGASWTDDTLTEIHNVEHFIEEWKTRTEVLRSTRIDWKPIFDRILSITKKRPSPNTEIAVKSQKYFLEIASLMLITKKRTIVNYIQWKSLMGILPYASRKMENLFDQASMDDVEDDRNIAPRWKNCLQQIGQNYASYSLFIKKYYQQNSRQAADNLYHRLRDSWKEQLDTSNWLSREAKNTAKQKIDTLSAVLGYSNFHEDDQKINDYFEDLKIGDSYIVNTINFIKHSWKEEIKTWGMLGRSVENLDNPVLRDAKYITEANTIELTPVYLQSPLFDGTLPNYIAYGTVGSLLGHEMSHALDYEDFSEMLTDSESSIYDEIVECFIHIYDIYFRMAETIHGGFIRSPESRGEFTQDENMADWSGLQIAFQAYKKMKKDKIPDGELKLPEFGEYTDEKMFFISYAQSWCNENLEDNWDDDHSPGYLRTNAVVSNNKDFAAAFNCSRNTPMNPEKKCSIWTK